MNEKAIQFGPERSLVGILSEPDPIDTSAEHPNIILLNAGMLHRVGPNRLSVKMARRLVESGFPVLRFDFSGIGDSLSNADGIPFDKRSIVETQMAMDFLCQHHGATSFIIAGICSGADVAVQTASHDDRVAGVIGINGSYIDAETWKQLAQTVEMRIQYRYYRKRLFSASRWLRLLSGQSNLKNIVRSLMAKIVMQSQPTQIEDPMKKTEPCILNLIDGGISTLLVYSEGSYALDIFELAVKGGLQKRKTDRVQVRIIRNCDHVFTLLENQKSLLDHVKHWITHEAFPKTA